MNVKDFYHAPTNTLTYLVYDENTKDGIVIDPVLDYDPASSTVSEASAKNLIDFVSRNEIKIHYIFETHAHADHLTSAQLLKTQWPEVQTAIHENIRLVQSTFKGVFNFDDDFDTEGKTFDHLLIDQEIVEAGTLKIQVIHTPGHTPACASLLVNEKILFTGDALFMPDFGTGRCDFPKGSAEDLYHSIHEVLYKLPDTTKVYVGHDYQPGGRGLEFQTTIGTSKQQNKHLKVETPEEEFVKFRTERDSGLAAPKLLLPSIQVNAQNGQFPKKESNGQSYLKLPIRQQ